MREIAGKLTAAVLSWVVLTNSAGAQGVTAEAVRSAAVKFAGGVSWRPSTVLTADFSCTGEVQQAILGASPGEIVVAIFTQGLEQAPALLRFDAEERNVAAAKIRVDEYALSAEEIAGVSGAQPVGYRMSATCHGVRLSDDSSQAAHIYWDQDNRRFDSWTQ